MKNGGIAMKDNEEKGTNNFSIPSEIELEIFSKLPVGSLCRFKCVSKLWKSIIENEPFRLVHSRILMSFWDDDRKRYMYSASLQGGDAIHHLTLPGCVCVQATRYLYRLCRCSISESINGFVCYYNGDYVYICNPSLEEFITLPRSERCTKNSTFSFGLNPWLNKYKVVHIFGDGKSVISGEIFTLRTDPMSGEVFALDTAKWKIVTGIPFLIPLNCKSVCVNGDIYWMWSQNEGRMLVLMAFDLGSEEFRIISYPKGTSSHSCLTKVRGCLALLDWGNLERIEIWVLENNPNNVWINERIVSPPYPCWIRNPISFENEFIGDMLLAPNVMSNEYIMFPYHLKKKSVRLVKISGLPDWLRPDLEFRNFRIINHIVSFSPLLIKRLR